MCETVTGHNDYKGSFVQSEVETAVRPGTTAGVRQNTKISHGDRAS
jgi:hypothetical protein